MKQYRGSINEEKAVLQLTGKTLSARGGLKGIRQIRRTGKDFRSEKRFGHRSDGMVCRKTEGLFGSPASTGLKRCDKLAS